MKAKVEVDTCNNRKPNGLGITSLVLGVMGMLPAVILAPPGLIVSIPAVVFGALQRKKNPNGIATAGLVLGIIATILCGIGALITFLFVGSAVVAASI